MYPIVNSPTRVTSTTQSCLDQYFINKQNLNFDIDCISSGISDHNTVLLNLHFPSSHYIKNSFYWKRSYSTVNFNHLNFLLSNEDWLDVLNEIDINIMVTNFFNVVFHYLNIALPQKKISLNTHKNCKSNNSWITKGIRISSNKKRMLYHIYKTTNDPHFKKYYNIYCKILRKVIYQARHMHNTNFIIKSDNINRALWQTIRKETCKQKFKRIVQN